MIDHVSDLKLQYLVELSKLGGGCARMESEVEQWLVDRGFVYGERTIPFVIMPHFISPGQLRRLSRAVASISPVLDRFCDAYPRDQQLREELQLSPEEDALMRIDPGFEQPNRVSRLDAFLHDYDVKFLEFNTDSPAGMAWTDMLYEALRDKVELPRVDRGLRHRVHAGPAGGGQHAARRLPRLPRHTAGPTRDTAACGRRRRRHADGR